MTYDRPSGPEPVWKRVESVIGRDEEITAMLLCVEVLEDGPTPEQRARVARWLSDRYAAGPAEVPE